MDGGLHENLRFGLEESAGTVATSSGPVGCASEPIFKAITAARLLWLPPRNRQLSPTNAQMLECAVSRETFNVGRCACSLCLISPDP